MRKDLLQALLSVETSASELQCLRGELRIKTLQNEGVTRDLAQVRASHERVLGEYRRMSAVRLEYRLQAADG